MFESISNTLGQCACFFAAGFIFGFIYEFFRFLRLLKRHNAVAVCIEDVIFFTLLAFVSFTISLMIGSGYFRFYYVVCEAFGGIAYYFTVGRLLQFVFGKIIGAIRSGLRFLFHKTSKLMGKVFGAFKHKIRPLFVKCNENVKAVVKKAKKRLPRAHRIMYNNNVLSEKKEGESKNVIKAQIRKKA